MSRTSAWTGSYTPNKRPYVVLQPDVYVAFQGTTQIEGCGECKKTIDINSYITGVSTSTNIDSPPGTASINLSIPDTDVTKFFNGHSFIIGSMMEVEIFAKGYFTVGGVPRYYKIFWGLVVSVSQSWSNGTTQITIDCKDILHWWEITNLVVNPSYVEANRTLAKRVSIWQNTLAGLNPYAVIIKLAQEATGDLSYTNFSFLAYRPEWGNERQFARSNLESIMLYWRAKFGKIWNSLVLYGASGQAYIPSQFNDKKTPQLISDAIIRDDANRLALTENSKLLNVSTKEIAAYKKEIARLGVNVFTHQDQSKLRIAGDAKDQIGYEFYCDTNGDIVFKPPFYNLNVLPNKPISWIQDYELIEDSVTENSDAAVTHLTSNGNAFGGIMDYGINDEVTTPYAGVFDYKLLKRYGWRRQDYPVEWAGNPRKLMYHLYDRLDQINAKSIETGTMSIPMRPELRMGFPIYVAKYDSFFYITGISHDYSVGSSATTRISVCAKRSKFVAPKNIGTIQLNRTNSTNTTPVSSAPGAPSTPTTRVSSSPTFKVTLFGQEPNVETEKDRQYDPTTGKLLGAPNIVMVFRSTLSGKKLNSLAAADRAALNQKRAPKAATKKKVEASNQQTAATSNVETSAEEALKDSSRALDLLRNNRYETAATNAGAYDFVRDVDGYFQQLSVVNANNIVYDNAPVNADSVAKNAEVSQKLRDFDKKRKDLLRKRNETTDVKKPAITDQITQLDAEIADFRKSASVKSKKDSPTNVIVRPVSDEFGFEVIGHYRYGRGSFIDQGRITVPDKLNSGQGDSTNNKIQVQFSVGMNEAYGSKASTDVAASFERMQAEDFQTGFNPDAPSGSEMTSSLTYSVNPEANAGKSVFIEADLLRSSLLLSELKPTVSNSILENAASDCSCSLSSRGDWSALIPQSMLKQLSDPQIYNPKNPPSDPQASFLNKVNKYLSDLFFTRYQKNIDREAIYDGSQVETATLSPTPQESAPAAPSLPPAVSTRADPLVSNVNTVVSLSADPIFQAVSRGDFEAAQRVIQQNRQAVSNLVEFESNPGPVQTPIIGG